MPAREARPTQHLRACCGSVLRRAASVHTASRIAATAPVAWTRVCYIRATAYPKGTGRARTCLLRCTRRGLGTGEGASKATPCRPAQSSGGASGRACTYARACIHTRTQVRTQHTNTHIRARVRSHKHASKHVASGCMPRLAVASAAVAWTRSCPMTACPLHAATATARRRALAPSHGVCWRWQAADVAVHSWLDSGGIKYMCHGWTASLGNQLRWLAQPQSALLCQMAATAHGGIWGAPGTPRRTIAVLVATGVQSLHHAAPCCPAAGACPGGGYPRRHV